MSASVLWTVAFETILLGGNPLLAVAILNVHFKKIREFCTLQNNSIQLF